MPVTHAAGDPPPDADAPTPEQASLQDAEEPPGGDLGRVLSQAPEAIGYLLVLAVFLAAMLYLILGAAIVPP